MPGLVVSMYRHAMIDDGTDVLDVGTGSGYGAALLARTGHRPLTTVVDATGPLPGRYDRIVSMTSVAPIPSSWLAALRPGGRLRHHTDRNRPDRHRDQATGRRRCRPDRMERAGFMHARAGPDYAPDLLRAMPGALDGDAGDVTTGRYPVINTERAWELYSMLGVTVPGLEHHFQTGPDGKRTAWLAHPDGSWARATAIGQESPVVRQEGPRRLWDTADEIRHAWLTDGTLPAYGAAVTISPDGGIRLVKGRWQAEIPATTRGLPLARSYKPEVKSTNSSFRTDRALRVPRQQPLSSGRKSRPR